LIFGDIFPPDPSPNNKPTKQTIMADVFPTTDTQLLPWLQNFCVKFAVHASPLGMTPAQINTTTADCNMLIYLLQTYVNIIRHDASEATKYKELIKHGPIGSPSAGLPAASGMPPGPAIVPAGALPRLRQTIREIKSRATYSEVIGTDLGIHTTTAVLSQGPPIITATGANAGHVTMGWTKNGWSGVKIQARAQNSATWEDLGTDLFSPFVDTRPLHTANTPEIREYRLCHLDGDEPLLNWSSVEVVTVKP
jgi:hypothetical protein